MSEEMYVDPDAFVDTPAAPGRSSAVLLWICVFVLAGIIASQVAYVRGLWYSVFSHRDPAGVAWRNSLEDAVAEADRTGKPLLLSFVSPSSPYCSVMRREVWCDPRLRPIVASQFVPVCVEIDSQPELVADFQVRSTPTVIVLEGKEERYREQGFIAAYDLAFRLQRATEPHMLAVLEPAP